MRRPRHLLFRLWLLLASGGGAVLDVGCASKCGSGCPPTEFQVLATAGDNLDVKSAAFAGPACPAYAPFCRGDVVNSCTRFSIVATASGACELTLTFFSSRPTFTAHVEFEPPVQQGCCAGFPVSGSPSVTVPALGAAPADAAIGDAADAADAEPGS